MLISRWRPSPVNMDNSNLKRRPRADWEKKYAKDMVTADPSPLGAYVPIPLEWNATTEAPPPDYNKISIPADLRDYYNLRLPKISPEQETPEDRNLRAWREANFRLPFDHRPNTKGKGWLNLGPVVREFSTGFLFGSLFTAFWSGPAIFRFLKRVHRRQLPGTEKFTFGERMIVTAKILKRYSKVAMLFGVFQVALRGFQPIIEPFMLPGIIGVILIGINHARKKVKRRIWKITRIENRWRPLGYVEDLQYRSILKTFIRPKINMTVRKLPGFIGKRIFRGAIIIALFEMFLHTWETTAKQIEAYFPSFAIMASPTYGVEPTEMPVPSLLKLPDVKPPAYDHDAATTAWLWDNNRLSGGGGKYILDERMFLLPDLRPVLEPTPDQLIKYDDTAITLLNNTPAYYLGRADWKNPNLPTGRHEPLINIGALPDGRYIANKVCLESVVQWTLDHDPRWTDPSIRDIATDLLNKAAADERVLAEIVSGTIKQDPWKEQAHRPLIMRDTRRLEAQADKLIQHRTLSWENLPLWGFLERTWQAMGPNPPTYKIEDGPGGYQNISPELIQARRQYVTELDPVAPATDEPVLKSPQQILRRLLRSRDNLSAPPPGLPEGVVPNPTIHKDLL